VAATGVALAAALLYRKISGQTHVGRLPLNMKVLGPAALIPCGVAALRGGERSPAAVEHDAADWLSRFEAIVPSDVQHGRPNPYREIRKELYAGTKHAINHGFDVNGVTVRLDPAQVADMQKSAQVYLTAPEIAPPADASTAQLQVIRGDCLEVARHFVEQGLSVCVLNMAASRHPGGGVENGAGAQEENFFRRSNYRQGLIPKNNPHLQEALSGRPYRVPEKGGIFLSGIQVFRGPEDQGYPFHNPFTVSAVASDAPRFRPFRDQASAQAATAEKRELIKEKIRAQFAIAASQSQDVLVLSAFGCGAFCGSPEVYAEIYKEVVEEYRGAFEHIVWAIIEDHNSAKANNPNGNVQPFADRLTEGTVASIEDLS
jgi:uncharacterized protein (TIGR02452 family)